MAAPPQVSACTNAPFTALRQLAAPRGLSIGAAVGAQPLRDDAAYRTVLAREFNMVVAENEMKFGPLCPQPAQYDFTNADTIVAFAAQHGMTVRGHTLVWHQQLPAWLEQGTQTPAQVKALLKQHIQTVVGRYRGRIAMWDVVNEAFEDNGPALRNSFWLKTLGPEYIAWAFQWAHAADPAAQLVYNDFGIEGLNAKSSAALALVTHLKAAGVPIHAVGMQMHIEPVLPFQLVTNIARFTQAGLQVQFTEVDVQLPMPAQPAALAQQADIYRALLETALATGVKTFVMWGFTDQRSWVPHFFKGKGAALPFDEHLLPKPAYAALHDVLAHASIPAH